MSARMKVLCGLCVVWGSLGLRYAPTSHCFRLVATDFPDSLPVLMKLTDRPDSQYLRPQAKSVEAYRDSMGRVRGPYLGRLNGHWYEPVTDSVKVWWEESDLDGIAFDARRVGDSLVGLTSWFSDRVVVGESVPRYRTVFVRHACP